MNQTLRGVLSVVLGVVAFSFVSSLSVARAETLAEMQLRLNELLRQLTALQSQMAQVQQGSVSWCPSIPRNLRFGESGSDVADLQTVLEREGFPVSSNEKSSQSFGESTAASVSGFQEKYRAEVLSPSGLPRGTGYMGPATRGKVAALYPCSGSQVSPQPAPLVGSQSAQSSQPSATASVPVPSTPSALPDSSDLPNLVATSVLPSTLSPVPGESIVITVSISNNGSVDAGYNETLMRVNGVVAQTAATLSSVPAHSVRQAAFYWSCPSAGSYDFSFEADYSARVREANEGDNKSSSASITCGAAPSGSASSPSPISLSPTASSAPVAATPSVTPAPAASTPSTPSTSSSSVGSQLQIPGQVTGLVADASQSGYGKITLRWSPVSGATSYIVKRGAEVLSTVETSNSFSDDTTKSQRWNRWGASYTYSVEARNSAGSGPSATASATGNICGGLADGTSCGASVHRSGGKTSYACRASQCVGTWAPASGYVDSAGTFTCRSGQTWIESSWSGKTGEWYVNSSCEQASGGTAPSVTPAPAASSSSLPNLSVRSVTPTSSSISVGQTITVTAVIANTGSGSAASSRAQLLVNGIASSTTVSIPTLSASSTHSAPFSWSCPSAGSYALSARADSGNAVAESSESDNDLASTTVTCGQASGSVGITLLPGQVTNLVASPTNPTDGRTVLSWSSVSGAAEYRIYRAVSGSKESFLTSTRGTSQTDSGLVAGQSYTYRVRAYGGAAAGEGEFSNSATVTAMASAPSLSTSAGFSTGMPVASAGTPDLVLDVVPTDIIPSVGRTIRFMVTERNAGGGSAGAYVTKITLQGTNTQLYRIPSLFTLGSGGSSSYQFPYWTCPAAGVYTFVAVIDAEGTVTESNELNNSKLVTLNCGGPLSWIPPSTTPAPEPYYDTSGGE